jgi:hypothetical protein
MQNSALKIAPLCIVKIHAQFSSLYVKHLLCDEHFPMNRVVHMSFYDLAPGMAQIGYLLRIIFWSKEIHPRTVEAIQNDDS